MSIRTKDSLIRGLQRWHYGEMMARNRLNEACKETCKKDSRVFKRDGEQQNVKATRMIVRDIRR
jgi:hypothetical protein